MTSRGAVLRVLFVGLLLAPSALRFPASAQTSVTLDDKVIVQLTSPLFNRATHTFDARATIVNTSQSVLDAPMLLVITGIVPGTVTLTNSTGTTAEGSPFVSVPVGTRRLGPGRAVTVLLQFSNPSRARFTVSRSVRGVIRAAPSVAALVPSPTVVELGTTQELALRLQNPTPG